MPDNWTYSELDRKTAQELAAFLPDRIFDAHAHLYRVANLNLPQPGFLTTGPQEATIEVWREHVGRQVGPSRLQGALFSMLPLLHPGDIDKENEFLLGQVNAQPHSRGLVVLAPESSPVRIAEYLKNPRVVGFKPYHVFSNEKPTFQASLASYLPEWAWEMANERGLVILLHLVKELALSDPDNQREIREKCQKYPEARLILAHAARGFHAPNTLRGIAALKGLQNVWFDTAAVCESAALKAILHEFGPRKLLWGSDFPVSEIRGRCVTLGDGFAWLEPDTVSWDRLSPACQPVPVGLESLRAIEELADDFCLSEQDLQDIFCDNALRLLGLKTESGTVTQALYQHARQRIPGGAQLLSKRPEMLAPNQWPAYFREARGCETWDLDGRRYYDFSSNGIGACLLGFRDPDVTRAVQRRINLGSMCTLNPPEEVELADLLCEIHPWAEQVRFARCGGEVGAVAVRIARATTDRSLIAICGYHGWHDWYLAANLGDDDALRGHLLPGLESLGVPGELRGTALTFSYNDREKYQAILDKHGDRLAAVIMEPCRSADPEPGFLEFVRDGAHKCGALLIFDEITIGWRLHLGGAHLRFGVCPDLAIFAKALGNGHPIAAVIGARQAMAGAHSSFISSTYWTESVGPVAALATVKKMREVDVPAHVARVGNQVQGFWQQAGVEYGLPVVTHEGYPCLAHFRFDHQLANELRTLYTQLMLERGFLAGVSLYPTLAHTDDIITFYGAAIDEVFAEIARALAADDVVARLKGPVAHTGFQRLVS
ncbi:MAG: class III aminotransferase [Chloroflexi bacterium HGW-Chloroflexi-1]|nr:MAG: class III aminotransferase [Chloroflexi bacterium HGW-Chloroflexi-1]